MYWMNTFWRLEFSLVHLTPQCFLSKYSLVDFLSSTFILLGIFVTRSLFFSDGRSAFLTVCKWHTFPVLFSVFVPFSTSPSISKHSAFIHQLLKLIRTSSSNPVSNFINFHNLSSLQTNFFHFIIVMNFSFLGPHWTSLTPSVRCYQSKQFIALYL